MKRKSILTAILSAFSLIVTAQSRVGYGVTSLGGANNMGVIFTYSPANGKDTVVFNFNGANGNGPYGNLMMAKDGLLYGTTTYGGTNDYGVIFSFDINTGSENVLFNFDSNTNGAYPLSTLIQANNGLLYGTTYSGGANKGGVLFSFNPVDNSYNVLLNFGSKTGEYPIGRLLQASDGNLYGMTSIGGCYNNGVLYCYNITTATDSVLVSFKGSNGSAPYGSLIEPVPGTLYGMTYGGGSCYKGVLFSYDIATGKEKVAVNFKGSNGAYPLGSLLWGGDNIMYGITYAGGDSNMGVVFSYDAEHDMQNVLFSFHGNDGRASYGSLVMDSTTSTIYGMTHWGGSQDKGALFSFTTGLGTENLLMSFSDSKGTIPDGDLLFIKHGVPTSLASEVTLNKDIILYPNPSKGDVYVTFTNTERHYIEMDDMAGRVINSLTCDGAKSLLPTTSLMPGIYMVRIYNKDRQYIATSRLVIE